MLAYNKSLVSLHTDMTRVKAIRYSSNGFSYTENMYRTELTEIHIPDEEEINNFIEYLEQDSSCICTPELVQVVIDNSEEIFLKIYQIHGKYNLEIGRAHV